MNREFKKKLLKRNIHVSLWIPPEVYEEFRKKVLPTGNSMSGIVTEMMRDYVKPPEQSA